MAQMLCTEIQWELPVSTVLLFQHQCGNDALLQQEPQRYLLKQASSCSSTKMKHLLSYYMLATFIKPWFNGDLETLVSSNSWQQKGKNPFLPFKYRGNREKEKNLTFLSRWMNKTKGVWCEISIMWFQFDLKRKSNQFEGLLQQLPFRRRKVNKSPLTS